MTGKCRKLLILVILPVLLADLVILSPFSLVAPYLYLRIVLSVLLIAFLPGFCIVRSLYPHGELEGIEELGYSIMISLLVSPLTAFFMSFLPWGSGTAENPAPLLVALSVITGIAAVTAYVRCRRGAKKLK